MAISVFFSYSHKDIDALKQLRDHLAILVRTGLIQPWDDRDIRAGSEWERDIDERLFTADLILILVSSSFAASDYAYEKELLPALDRHKRGEATVVPVLLGGANWDLAPFATLNWVPRDGKGITEIKGEEAQRFKDVAVEIRKVVEHLTKEREKATAANESVIKPSAIHVPREDDSDVARFYVNALKARGAIADAALSAKPPAKRILSVVGPASIGKSALLRMGRYECTQKGVPVALARCEQAKTPIGLLRALAAELQLDSVVLERFNKVASQYMDAENKPRNPARPDSSNSSAGSNGLSDAVVQDLAGLPDLLKNGTALLSDAFLQDLTSASVDRRVVLMVDKWEALSSRDKEDWAWNWMERLPPNVVLVVTSNKGLDPDPLSSQLRPKIDECVTILKLEALSPEDRQTLIERTYDELKQPRPDPETVAQLVQWSGGNPMWISIAVLKLIRSQRRFDDIIPDIDAKVEQILFHGIPDPHKRLLEAAAVVRQFDREILNTLVSPQDVQRFFDDLAGSGYVEPNRRKYAVLESVRNTLQRRLKDQDAVRYQKLHADAAAYYKAKANARTGTDSVEVSQSYELEQIYHQFAQDRVNGFELFRQTFQTAFFAARRFDFCRALLSDVRTYDATDTVENWASYFEALMAVYLEPRSSKSREILEELRNRPGLDPELKADALEYLASIYWYYGLKTDKETALASLVRRLPDVAQSEKGCPWERHACLSGKASCCNVHRGKARHASVKPKRSTTSCRRPPM